MGAIHRIAEESAMSVMQAGGYEIDIVVQGYPGKAVCHGGLGWSTIALIRGHGRVALIDVGSFAYRPFLAGRLAKRGLKPSDVTDVILTHAHHDHSINWVLFSNATVHIGGDELKWAMTQPWGETPVPELYVRELDTSPRLRRIKSGDEVLPGIKAYDAPGHTPGHLIFVASGGDRDVIFTGDAAKNRVELLGGKADNTYDQSVSMASIATIWTLWRRRPGSILVPGHDIPMTQTEGRIEYLASRTAVVKAWFGNDLETMTSFELKA
jgi:N-acyl homoserine lactone hydrolase